MRIVIDMQGAQTASRFRGIGRYTMSFVQAIVRNRLDHEIILALNGLFTETIEPIRAAFYDLLPQENIRVWYMPDSVCDKQLENTVRREAAELIREAFLVNLNPDIIHITSLFEGYIDDAVTSIHQLDSHIPVSVTLYDLIPLLNPEQYLKPSALYEQYYFRKIEYLKRASALLSISEFSRQEALVHLSVSGAQVINVSTAIEPFFKPIEIEEAVASYLHQKFSLDRPFVFYTGAADDRKNLPRLIEAFAALPSRLRETYQLLMAGKMSNGNISQLKKIAKEYGLNEGDLRLIGYVTDEELVRLYNMCELYVFASWHEGFGLPALEAMACGAAVIGSNVSSLPEVIGLDEALFDPLDVSAITSKMTQALEDVHFRLGLREHGLQQARKFSWDESARKAIDSFSKISARSVRNKAKQSANEITQKLINELIGLKSIDFLSNGEYQKVASSIAQNIPEPERCPKLFVDISELAQHDAKTGIQRVTRCILHELVFTSPPGYEVQAVYATQGRSGYRLASDFIKKSLGENADGSIDNFMDAQPGDIFLGLDLQHHAVTYQNDYLEKLHQLGVRVYFVIYDLLPVIHPHAFPSGTKERHIEWLKRITKFSGVVCISKAVADEIVDWMKANGINRLRPIQVSWFHLGADIDNYNPSKGMPDNAQTILSSLIGRISFLMVGTLEPRKGQTQVLRAFEQLWQSGLNVNLVIVGKQGWMVEELVKTIRQHPELGKRLFWLKSISDEYLQKVYAASTCLIAASEGEGFGLPLIEAAQHKLPIIARDIPVFKEVAGKHAYYFSGKEADSLALAIQNWLELYNRHEHPNSDDMPWLTWKESAAQVLRKILYKEDITLYKNFGHSVDIITPRNSDKKSVFISINGEDDIRKNDNEKIVFLHIPKTGGTTLHNLILKNFHSEKVCPERFNSLKKTPVEQLNSCNFFSGHYDWDNVEYIPGNKKIISLLRNPRDRILSLYHFWRSHTWEYIKQHNLGGPRYAKTYELNEFLSLDEPAVISNIDNALIRNLLGRVYAGKNREFLYPENELFERAVSNLEELHSIGILEYTRFSIEKILKSLGFVPPKHIPRERDSISFASTPAMEWVERQKVSSISESALASLTKYDDQIYQYVLDKYHPKLCVNDFFYFTEVVKARTDFFEEGWQINNARSCVLSKAGNLTFRLETKVKHIEFVFQSTEIAPRTNVGSLWLAGMEDISVPIKLDTQVILDTEAIAEERNKKFGICKVAIALDDKFSGAEVFLESINLS